MATVQEVDGLFAPDTGQVWSTYNSKLKPMIMQQGAQFVQAPTSPGPVNPRFINFFNRAWRLSSALYPNNAKSAAFTFNLRFIPGNGVSSGTIVMDGQKINSGSAPQAFNWNGATAQNASLLVDGIGALPSQGTWSVFQLVRRAQHSSTAVGYRLDYSIVSANAITVQGQATSAGTSGSQRLATFELSGPAADILVGDAFAGAACVQPLPK